VSLIYLKNNSFEIGCDSMTKGKVIILIASVVLIGCVIYFGVITGQIGMNNGLRKH
jgi:hypothetical protein